jgi:hypothetical protein
MSYINWSVHWVNYGRLMYCVCGLFDAAWRCRVAWWYIPFLPPLCFMFKQFSLVIMFIYLFTVYLRTVIAALSVPWQSQLTNKLHGAESFWWDADVSVPNQEIPCTLWSPMVHYRAHNSPHLAPAMSRISPGRVCLLLTFKTHFNIFPIYAYVYRVVSFLEVSTPKPLMIMITTTTTTWCERCIRHEAWC